MHLEFERDYIPESLHSELGFDQYLKLFDVQMPVLPGRILRPMKKGEGLAHFKELTRIETALAGEDVAVLLELCRELPDIDLLLPGYEAEALEQYHLFDMGRFIEVEQSLGAVENRFSLVLGGNQFLDEMQRVLKAGTRAGYSVLRGGERASRLRVQIEDIEDDLKKSLLVHEKQIRGQTGLTMIYPWPCELVQFPAEGERISACKLVRLKKQSDGWLVEHRLGAETAALVKRRDGLVQTLEVFMQELLDAMNRELSPYFEKFATYYQNRKKRSWLYLLLMVKQSRDLVLPEFSIESGCRLQQAVMPVLQEKRRKECVPLDLQLLRGANVLFGPHMSGKTTVLKTLYFFLTLVRVGLPVPADAMRLNYPEEVSIMLRSSGDMRKDLSSFGEELTFFSNEIGPGAYVLADELFLSTDPVNGARLSDVFIRTFSTKDMVFLCTTHYPTVLDIESIALLRMLDSDCSGKKSLRNALDVVRDNMPYRLEKITDSVEKKRLKENTGPLKIAMLFPLTKEIKDKIRQKINNQAE